MKPFLLRMSKAHYLINLQLYQTIDNRCRIPPYSNSPNLQVGRDTHGFRSLPGFFCILLRMTIHVSMVYDQTIDGRRNREQIWGSYFVIEMIKLSYLGLLIVGLLHEARTCMCHKILKSCCIGLVEFIHKDYNTLNYRRHKPYTGNRYCYDFLALFKMIFLLK